MYRGRTIEEIWGFDAKELLQECEGPFDVLVRFYKVLCAAFGLDWDDVSNIDPVKIRVSEEDWSDMCDKVVSFGTDNEDRASLGFMFVNKGPGSDPNLPVGALRLLKGWIEEVSRE